MFCLIKAIVAWVILLIIETNLVGLVVQGLFWSLPRIDAPTDRVREVLTRESRRLVMVNHAITLFFFVLTAAHFFALYYFWNIGLAVTAGLVMISRLPDLLSELRTEAWRKALAAKGIPVGKKALDARTSKGAIYVVTTVLDWLCLPLTWYCLCRWTYKV